MAGYHWPVRLAVLCPIALGVDSVVLKVEGEERGSGGVELVHAGGHILATFSDRWRL
jgi:hypothetical protein